MTLNLSDKYLKNQEFFEHLPLFALNDTMWNLFPESACGHRRISVLLIDADPVLQPLEELLIVVGLFQHTDEMFGHVCRVAAR